MVTVNLTGAYVSNIAPLHPQRGDIWFDSAFNRHRIFNGKTWVYAQNYKSKEQAMVALKHERYADEQDARFANRMWIFKRCMIIILIFTLLLSVAMCNKEYQRTHPWGVTEQEQ
jgi:hypothetical protein